MKFVWHLHHITNRCLLQANFVEKQFFSNIQKKQTVSATDSGVKNTFSPPETFPAAKPCALQN